MGGKGTMALVFACTAAVVAIFLILEWLSVAAVGNCAVLCTGEQQW